MIAVSIYHRTPNGRYLAAVLRYETDNVPLARDLAAMKYPDRRRYSIVVEPQECDAAVVELIEAAAGAANLLKDIAPHHPQTGALQLALARVHGRDE